VPHRWSSRLLPFQVGAQIGAARLPGGDAGLVSRKGATAAVGALTGLAQAILDTRPGSGGVRVFKKGGEFAGGVWQADCAIMIYYEHRDLMADQDSPPQEKLGFSQWLTVVAGVRRALCADPRLTCVSDGGVDGSRGAPRLSRRRGRARSGR
jgi:hypothetical protein